MDVNKVKLTQKVSYSQLEEKIYNIFYDAITETLSKDIVRNLRVRLNSRERLDIDLVINDRSNNPFAFICIMEKMGKGAFPLSLLKEKIQKAAFATQTTWCFICSSEKIYYLKLFGKSKEWLEKKLTSRNIKELLSKNEGNNNANVGVSVEDVRNTWLEILNEVGLDNIDSLKDFINESSFTVKNESSYYCLDEKLEDGLFTSILGPCKEEYLCRFTSLASIFRSCNEKKQSMCCLVCMNDKSEINYAANKTQSTQTTMEENNACYIMSCCSDIKRDDFTMMRLYGDDGRGVCIRYKVDYSKLIKDRFILAPISYARDKYQNHPELDFINSIQKKKIKEKQLRLNRWHIWQHFFKPFEYKDECEIRLLFFDKCIDKETENHGMNSIPKFRRKWIHESNFGIITPILLFDIGKNENVFPLVINGITIGRKDKEFAINVDQLTMLIRNSGIEYDNARSISDIVEPSSIEHYR